VKALEARQQLNLSKGRFYELYADYLRACARHQQDRWLAGLSGGDHAPAWPAKLIELLRKRLSSRPPASYSFAASEAARLLNIKMHRAQVRRWAMENGLVQTNPRLKTCANDQTVPGGPISGPCAPSSKLALMAAFPSAHNDYALKLPQAQKSSIAPTRPATSASCLRNQPLKTPHVCSSQIDHKQKSGFASTQKSGFENNTTHDVAGLVF
jgi:hypothetical protein